MKIVADDGTEYEVRSANQGYELLRKLIPPVPKSGHRPWATYVEKYRDGFRSRRVEQDSEVLGPKRATREEARADHDRMMVRTPLAPPTMGRGSEHSRENHRLAALARHAALKAASPDGHVRLAPPTCHHCQQQGHKSNQCPAKGWAKKTYVRKTGKPRPHKPHVCKFCGGGGHIVRTCPKRKAVLMQRFRRFAA